MENESECATLRSNEKAAKIVKSKTEKDDPCGSYWRDGLYQGFVSLVAMSMLIHPGVGMGFSTILRPQLNVNNEENSWIASLVAIGTPVGSMSAGPLMIRMGKKNTCILTCGIAILSWSALFFMPQELNMTLLLIGRFLNGVVGGLTAAGLLYVSEVANKHWRSVFLGFASVLLSAGVLLVTTVGVLMPWRPFSLFCLLLGIVNLVLLFIIPESPHWLIGSRPDKAKKALMRLNKNKQAFEEEWRNLDSCARKQEKGKSIDAESTKPSFSSPKVYRPFILLLTSFTLQQFCGVYPIIFYSLELFNDITNKSSPPVATGVPSIPAVNFTSEQDFLNSSSELQYSNLNTTIAPVLPPDRLQILSLATIGLIRFIMSILAVVLSKKVGRRPLLISSCVGSAIAGFSFSFYTLGLFGPTTDVISISLVLVFLLFSSYGLLVIPWAQIGEIIPSSHRTKGGSILISYAYILMFVVVKCFPSAVELFGVGGVFLFFSTVTVLEAIFVYFFIPETLGRTFSEIEQLFE